MFKKKPLKATMISQDVLMFVFFSFITTLVSGVTKLGFFASLFFMLFLFFYFLLLRFIFQMVLKLVRNFVLSTVEHGKDVDK